MEELTFKQIMQHPLLKKNRGKLSELEAAIGENGVRRLKAYGYITSKKPKTWYRKCETWYLNDWFLTKEGKESRKLYDDRYTIIDRINDFILVYVFIGKTRYDRIKETLEIFNNDDNRN